MPKFTDHFITRVKDATDIVQVIGRHVQLKQTGADFTGLCPFHQERSPSFTVSPKKKLFQCFGCDKGGDVFGFICAFKGDKFQDVVLALAAEAGIQAEYETPPAKPAPKPLPPESPTPGGNQPSQSEPSRSSSVNGEAAVPASHDASPASAASTEAAGAATSGESFESAAPAPAPTPGNLVKFPGTAVPPSPPLPSEPGEPSESGQKKTPLERFFELALPLSAADREELHVKRGLSYEAIDRAQLRTNDAPNEKALWQVGKEFGVGVCVRVGLFRPGDKRKQHARPRPAGQYYGWGRVGKKSAEPDPEGDIDYDDLSTDEFEWAHKSTGKVNPILIPYFDRAGKLIGLRPHKGFPKGQKPRLFVARTRGGTSCVITEGEFKALALADVLTEWSVGAIPGIQMCKNYDVWNDLKRWLAECGPNQVVVAFDNEDKSHKARFEARYDAPIWARVLALKLEAEGYAVAIATLPDDWRVDGKADWDGALAKFRAAGESDEAIAQRFRDVLNGGLRHWQFKQLKMFGSDVERGIANQAALYAYEDRLPNGGKREQRLALELRRLSHRLKIFAGRILPLAEAYEQTRGWYYEFSISQATLEKTKQDMADAFGLERALQNGRDWKKLGSDLVARIRHESWVDLAWARDLIRFLEIAAKGIPKRCGPFSIKAHYVLVKTNGERERLVRLRNIQGETTKLVSLPSRDRTAPRDMRTWLSNQGNFGWESGERPLQTLMGDMDFRLAWREVQQLVYYGCEEADMPWFFDDMAILGDQEVERDAEGVFWFGNRGWTFLRDKKGFPMGDEDQPFALRDLPKMHPGLGLRMELTGAGASQTYGFSLAKGADDPDALRQLLGELAACMEESFAERDGLLLLGAFVSYAAGPELYEMTSGFPGVWVVGEKGSGKTVSAKVAMAMWGYGRLDSATSLKSCTTVALIHSASQLANIPNWADEYIEAELKEVGVKKILHAGWGREIPGKHTMDGVTRTIRTNFIVTGQTTCTDLATMDRYLTVVAAKENWKGTVDQQVARHRWLLGHRPYYFAIVRAVLRRRKEFVATLQEVLERWERRPELSGAEQRSRFAHGVVLGALHALNRVIPFRTTVELERLEQWLMNRCVKASREVQRQVNVNQFFEYLISAVKAGAFGFSPSELKRYFKVMPVRGHPPPEMTEEQVRAGADGRFGWTSLYFYFVPGDVIDVMLGHLRTRGVSPMLRQLDMRRLFETQPYWRPPPLYASMHVQKFSGKSNEKCWCLEVDKIPDFGYVPVTDEAFEASKYRNGDVQSGNYLALSDEWVDPRKGDLFFLIDQLTQTSK